MFFLNEGENMENTILRFDVWIESRDGGGACRLHQDTPLPAKSFDESVRILQRFRDLFEQIKKENAP
jgi:hypothetical protein